MDLLATDLYPAGSWEKGWELRFLNCCFSDWCGRSLDRWEHKTVTRLKFEDLCITSEASLQLAAVNPFSCRTHFLTQVPPLSKGLDLATGF